MIFTECKSSFARCRRYNRCWYLVVAAEISGKAHAADIIRGTTPCHPDIASLVVGHICNGLNDRLVSRNTIENRNWQDRRATGAKWPGLTCKQYLVFTITINISEFNRINLSTLWC